MLLDLALSHHSYSGARLPFRAYTRRADALDIAWSGRGPSADCGARDRRSARVCLRRYADLRGARRLGARVIAAREGRRCARRPTCCRVIRRRGSAAVGPQSGDAVFRRCASRQRRARCARAARARYRVAPVRATRGDRLSLGRDRIVTNRLRDAERGCTCSRRRRSARAAGAFGSRAPRRRSPYPPDLCEPALALRAAAGRQRVAERLWLRPTRPDSRRSRRPRLRARREPGGSRARISGCRDRIAFACTLAALRIESCACLCAAKRSRRKALSAARRRHGIQTAAREELRNPRGSWRSRSGSASRPRARNRLAPQVSRAANRRSKPSGGVNSAEVCGRAEEARRARSRARRSVRVPVLSARAPTFRVRRAAGRTGPASRRVLISCCRRGSTLRPQRCWARARRSGSVLLAVGPRGARPGLRRRLLA